MREADGGLRKYFEFYNNERLHQSLEYRIQATLYFSDAKAGEGGVTRTVEMTR